MIYFSFHLALCVAFLLAVFTCLPHDFTGHQLSSHSCFSRRFTLKRLCPGDVHGFASRRSVAKDGFGVSSGRLGAFAKRPMPPMPPMPMPLGTERSEVTGWGAPNKEFLGRCKVMPRLVKATPIRWLSLFVSTSVPLRGGISNQRSTAGFCRTRFWRAAVTMLVHMKMKTPPRSGRR